MENFYEELYQYLIERGIDDDEATEVVNYLYEDNIHEYGLITENKGRAFLNMLKAVGYMSGVLKKPGARQAVKQVTKKVQGTPLQGNLLTKAGKAQDFTKGKMPFTSTSPVPAASSPLPMKPPVTPEVPGQMRIPGMSDTAQTLSRITGKPMGPGGMGISMSGSTKGLPRRAPKPEFGPGAVKPTSYAKSKPELRPDGVAPKPEFGTPPGLKSKPAPAPRTNKAADAEAALKRTTAMTAPSLPKADKVVDAVRTINRANKALTAAGVAGVTAGSVGLTGALVDKANKESNRRRVEREQQRSTKLAQQKAETQAASQPKPEPTGERSAEANQEKQEKAKAEAEKVRRSKDQLSAAAKDFDKSFAAARKAGKKEFTWRGRTYNTKLKEGYVDPYQAPPAHGRSMQGKDSTERLGNPARLSPAMKATQRSDQLRQSEPGSRRERTQTRRAQQMQRALRSGMRATGGTRGGGSAIGGTRTATYGMGIKGDDDLTPGDMMGRGGV